MTNSKPRQRGRPFSATPAHKISVTVSWDNWEPLEAAKEGITRSAVINDALKAYFRES